MALSQISLWSRLRLSKPQSLTLLKQSYSALNFSKNYYQNQQQANENKIIKEQISKKVAEGPGLNHFLTKKLTSGELQNVSHPYLSIDDISGDGRKVFFNVYGCQMNESDTEIAWSILKQHGYEMTKSHKDADVIFIMTCSIREGAETKIWTLLESLRALKKHKSVKIGVLGCMAERLKTKLLEKETAVDLVAGPDSYRDLPRLLAITYGGEKTVNVLLSHDETYAEIKPVSLSPNNVSAFVSIMRGCDNMCTYCIVPFTRGKERSRNISSIVDEVKYLSEKGLKEVTLVGQNVNSYRDISEQHTITKSNVTSEITLAKGFKTIYKPKMAGRRFADLLDRVSAVNPEMRIRFVSPHPKDFPDEVLQIIKERPNICNHLHLPAQSGNTRVLEMMRRGYSRESYIDLVHHIRAILPGVTLTSDFIAGFCTESDEEFLETLSLMELVRYNFCYVFPYSLREKTAAHRRFEDDVPQDVKIQRNTMLADTFRRISAEVNGAQIGQRQLVLVEKTSKRSDQEFVGRNDGNTKVIFAMTDIPLKETGELARPCPGDYVEVEITGSTSQTLKAAPLCLSSIREFNI